MVWLLSPPPQSCASVWWIQIALFGNTRVRAAAQPPGQLVEVRTAPRIGLVRIALRFRASYECHPSDPLLPMQFAHRVSRLPAFFAVVTGSAATLLAVPLRAQPGVVFKWQRIPSFIDMDDAGSLPGERIALQWTCGESDASTLPALGSPVLRTLTLDGTAIQVRSTVTAADRKTPRKAVVLDTDTLRLFRGTVSIDKTHPNRLRVNPWLWTTAPAYAVCPELPDSADQKRSAEARLRDVELYYDLKNRQTIAFRTYTVGFSGISVPLRQRRGFTKGTDTIASAIPDALNLGAMLSFSGSSTRYQYVRHADTPLREPFRISVGTFALLGKGTVGTATSKLAATPVTTESSFLTISPGLAFTVHVKGVDIGVFAGPEYPLGGSDASKWDYKGRWWHGIGLGFVPGS